MTWELWLLLLAPTGAFLAVEALTLWLYHAEEYFQDEWDDIVKMNEGPWSDD